jgi:hypothetical protein
MPDFALPSGLFEMGYILEDPKARRWRLFTNRKEQDILHYDQISESESSWTSNGRVIRRSRFPGRFSKLLIAFHEHVLDYNAMKFVKLAIIDPIV